MLKAPPVLPDLMEMVTAALVPADQRQEKDAVFVHLTGERCCFCPFEDVTMSTLCFNTSPGNRIGFPFQNVV